MLLTGAAIRTQHARGRIIIDPFDPASLNPDSYDIHLAATLRRYTRFPLDALSDNPTEAVEIPPDGLVLEPQHLYLGHTCEVVGSAHYAPALAARSSIARLGLFITISASLGEVGTIGQWPLQLVAVQPLRIYAGMRVGQVIFWKVGKSAPPATNGTTP
ncbi:MAG: dCTP deaminase [Ktedonobacterales bacterium]|nr:dCTP deaminase [Ktedonobacterales bacterium]